MKNDCRRGDGEENTYRLIRRGKILRLTFIAAAAVCAAVFIALCIVGYNAGTQTDVATAAAITLAIEICGGVLIGLLIAIPVVYLITAICAIRSANNNGKK